jgi:hypothetical protein
MPWRSADIAAVFDSSACSTNVWCCHESSGCASAPWVWPLAMHHLSLLWAALPLLGLTDFLLQSEAVLPIDGAEVLCQGTWGKQVLHATFLYLGDMVCQIKSDIHKTYKEWSDAEHQNKWLSFRNVSSESLNHLCPRFHATSIICFSRSQVWDLPCIN